MDLIPIKTENGGAHIVCRKAQLEEFLRKTQADQGGEASFEDFVKTVADDEDEYAHEEARAYLVFGPALQI